MNAMKWLLSVAVATAIMVPLQSAHARDGHLYGRDGDATTRLGDYHGDDDGIYRVHYRGRHGHYRRHGHYGRHGYYGRYGYYGRPGGYYRGHRRYYPHGDYRGSHRDYGRRGDYGPPRVGYRRPAIVTPVVPLPPPPPLPPLPRW